MMRWLTDCRGVALPSLDTLITSPPPAIPTNPKQYTNDPLVPVSGVATNHIYSRLGFKYVPPVVLARREVLRRLLKAQRRLPHDFTIVVLDGWRSRMFQRELFEHYRALATDCTGYVADPDSAAGTPPHVTGGAFDITLAWRAEALGLGTDYDEFSPLAAPQAFEDDDSHPVVRDLRRMLSNALAAEGFVCDPLEWWHWSFGDAYWATRNSADEAMFGEIEPEPGLL
jgi:zinc D-Ala-D-Ala dipeptidase